MIESPWRKKTTLADEQGKILIDERLSRIQLELRVVEATAANYFTRKYARVAADALGYVRHMILAG